MASSNTTRKSTSLLEPAFGSIPTQFRGKIIKSYLEIKRRHSEGRHESAGLSGGKLCESVLRLLQHQLTGSFTAFGTPIQNFHDECEKLGKVAKTTGNESLRIVLPRALALLYTLRNKRGIGHVGGDVDANAVDSATVSRLADWIVCELIRVFHSLSLEDAQALVDSLASRNLPHVWQVSGKKRVLTQGLDFKQQVLLLLYSDTDSGVLTEDLFSWTEYSNLAMFKKSVLGALHNKRLIEYDRETETVVISPLGTRYVDEDILPLLDG